jgi:hypothetical protein
MLANRFSIKKIDANDKVDDYDEMTWQTTGMHWNAVCVS